MADTWFSERIKDGTIRTGLVENITAGKTLVAAEDNGKLFVLADAAPGTITLPAVTNAGFFCKVVCGFAITTNGVVASAEGDNMEGAIDVNSTLVTVNAADQINFVSTAENIGDWATFESDGTYWYVNGTALNAGGMTATG